MRPRCSGRETRKTPWLRETRRTRQTRKPRLGSSRATPLLCVSTHQAPSRRRSEAARREVGLTLRGRARGATETSGGFGRARFQFPPRATAGASRHSRPRARPRAACSYRPRSTACVSGSACAPAWPSRCTASSSRRCANTACVLRGYQRAGHRFAGSDPGWFCAQRPACFFLKRVVSNFPPGAPFWSPQSSPQKPPRVRQAAAHQPLIRVSSRSRHCPCARASCPARRRQEKRRGRSPRNWSVRARPRNFDNARAAQTARRETRATHRGRFSYHSRYHSRRL